MSQNLIDDLLRKFESELPGERAHFEMAPINRPLSSFALKNAISPRESAVSVILYPKDDTINFRHYNNNLYQFIDYIISCK